MAGEIVRRPDLEQMQVAFPDYIGNIVYPWLGKPQVSGTIYYQKYKDDIAIQENRNTAALGDITQTVIAGNSFTFACHELRARIAMGYTERISYSDNEHADMAQGRMAKRAYFNKIETLCATNLFKADGAIDGTADPVATIDTNVSLLRDAGIGRVALVLSNHNKVLLKNNEIIRDRMKSTGVGVYSLEDIRNLGDIQLAAALGVDTVLTMRDQIGYAGVTGASKDMAALVVLADEYTEPSETIQYARLVYFQYTDSADDRFCVESFVNPLNDSFVVDCKGLVELKELNPELKKTIRIFNNNSDSVSA